MEFAATSHGGGERQASPVDGRGDLWVPKTSSDAATRDDVQGGSVDRRRVTRVLDSVAPVVGAKVVGPAEVQVRVHPPGRHGQLEVFVPTPLSWMSNGPRPGRSAAWPAASI